MPRFVLLDHDHPSPHLDFMLEAGEGLWTWRLRVLPEMGHQVEAIRLADHRRLYLDYEGPVSGDRGSVRRREHGEFDWLVRGDGQVCVELRGQSLRARWTLEREEEDRWVLRQE